MTGDAGDAAGEGFAGRASRAGRPDHRRPNRGRSAARARAPRTTRGAAPSRGRQIPVAGSDWRQRWIAVGHSHAADGTGYDAYVTLSPFQAQFQTHLDGRVVRIPNGVDLPRFPVRPRPAARRPLSIVSLGRLGPGKFPYRVLEHLPDLEALDARVLIAGRGPRRWELEPEIARRGLGEPRAVRRPDPVARRARSFCSTPMSVST